MKSTKEIWEEVFVWSIIILAIVGFIALGKWGFTAIQNYEEREMARIEAELAHEESIEARIARLEEKIVFRSYILQMIDCRISKKIVKYNSLDGNLYCGDELFEGQ